MQQPEGDVGVSKPDNDKTRGSLLDRLLQYKHTTKLLAASLLLCLAIILSTAIPLHFRHRPYHHRRNPRIEYTPCQPPSFPLAVRNPYLSAWVPGSWVNTLPEIEAQFWAGQRLTWSIAARVDGVTYNLFGVPNPGTSTKSAIVRNAQYTATNSLFTLHAGPAIITLDFFSPVSPTNYLRQSLPFSYLTIGASSISATTVEVYSDIDSTWTGQEKNSTWTYEKASSISIFTISALGAPTYSQNDMDQALWGDAIFSSQPSANSTISVQTGAQRSVRKQFADHGSLNGTIAAWAPGGVTAISHDFGNVTRQVNATYAIGYVREKAIDYLGTPYTGYYAATYPNTTSAVTHFFSDQLVAEEEAIRLQSDLTRKSVAIGGQNYSDILTLSMRQAYGGLDLTIPLHTLNQSDPLFFIKEISSDGNVNTIDVIYPAFPLYYITDPEYIRLLLEPVVRYLAAGKWPHAYVIHDIGFHYPNATGHDFGIAEAMPIEETGNLLILAYAYSTAVGNTTWASNYTRLFQGYADYLVTHGQNISKQLSTNDAAGPLVNETNLGVKAAVGLKAFGALSGMSNYSTIGDAFATRLYEDGLATDVNKTHFTLTYPSTEKPSSWKVTFNLWPDYLLNLTTFPTVAYDMQSSFYPTVRHPGGVSLDNRQWWGKSDWNIWAAATRASNSTRDMFVNDIWKYMTEDKNTWPFSDRWVTWGVKGKTIGREWALRARPTVGAHFALLANMGARYLSWG
ncbi:DUF1793-domain-containing protein [Coleophoma crateriformis]|uniref:DUF1793-domain-containing protein n=1 Tax=Coleophoma crateriformis TaxID=565419 RepID=A0A3D8RE21_9HELO|nr:DUF1793-domain-containing protein [Coleophoma crateriformis]